MNPATIGEARTTLDGRHYEAYCNQERLYQAVLAAQHHLRGALKILDFGCGEEGVSRVILRGSMGDADTLFLYDPEARIHPPRDQRERIASGQNVYGDQRIPFDIVTLSYVLCCMEPQELLPTLQHLRTSQPQAVMIIVEYVLCGRSSLEILGLLTANEEMKWRAYMGEDHFVETRERFTRESLETLLRKAGFSLLGRVAPLDRAGIRAAAVTLP